MNRLRVLIVDDEPLAVRRLQIALGRIPEVELVGVAEDGRSALEAIAASLPDVVLLDIKMPGLNGFEVAEALDGAGAPAVIFVTAFDRFAVKAFDAHALDYLVKPVEFDRLVEALGRARERRDQQTQAAELEELKAVLAQLRAPESEPAPDSRFETEFWVRDRQGYVRVPVARIEWIDAERDYVRLHAGGRAYMLRDTMQRLEERLDPSTFARIHRSVIVQIGRVEGIRKTATGALRAVMSSGAELPIGRRHAGFVERLVRA
jgi:two-component system, LytTR family, response regulator